LEQLPSSENQTNRPYKKTLKDFKEALGDDPGVCHVGAVHFKKDT
jgi:hypothetical protein